MNNEEEKINEENLHSENVVDIDNPIIVRDEDSISDHYKPSELSIDGDDVTYVESTEDGDVLPTKDITKQLREEIKNLRKEKEEYLTGWQRAKADYINLKKELDSSHLNSSIFAKEKMARNLMPVLDSFDMAFANKEVWEKVDQNWRTGVEYIYTQLLNGLSDSGIEKIDKVGIPFDPNLHQSINAVPTDKEEQDHTIESIVQVGYKIGERVVRPARVNIYEFKK